MSLFQIGGLVSGLDTKSIIQQLMDLQARPIVQLDSRKTDLNKKAQAVADIGTRIANLSSILSSLKLSSNINKKSVSTTQLSGSTVSVGVTPTSSAANQTFKLTIKQLATQTAVKSTAAIGTSVTATALLTGATDGATGTGLSESVTAGTFTIGRDGVLSTFTIDAASTLNSVITSLNATFGVGFATLTSNKLVLDISAGGGGTTFNIGTAGDTSNFLRVTGLADAKRDAGAAATVTGAAVGAGNLGDLSVVLNGVTISVPAVNEGSATANANKIASYLNQQSTTTKVTATVTGAGTNEITLTHQTAGSGNNIVIGFASAATGLTAATTSGTDANTIRSARPLGITQASATMENARFAVAITAGASSFTINGVSFSYNANTDSLNTIISNINSSAAGVTAAYDPVEDKLLLTATGTGSQSISLANVAGNFLTVVGVLSATQTLGKNAIYTIDTVAAGADQTSASNTVTPLPGVTLELKGADSSSAITVTLAQDVASTVSLVQAYVQQFNSTASFIEDLVRFDTDPKKKGLLVGDSPISSLLVNLRSLTVGQGDGLTGTYTAMSQIGLSFKKVGTDRLELQLDSTKLTDALRSTPNTVADVFTKRETSSVLTPTAGNIASISGTENVLKKAGTYTFAIDTAASPNLTVTFDPTDGSPDIVTTYSVTAASVNTSIVPGITITFAGVLTTGSDKIVVTVPKMGVGQKLADYVTGLLRADSVFDARKDRAASEAKAIDVQITKLRLRLAAEEQNLIKKFARLEATLVRLNQQQSSLSATTALAGSR